MAVGERGTAWPAVVLCGRAACSHDRSLTSQGTRRGSALQQRCGGLARWPSGQASLLTDRSPGHSGLAH